MTQPAKVQEPSMEEILASIRRIIADDETKPATPEKAIAAQTLAAKTPPASAPASFAPRVEPPAPAKPAAPKPEANSQDDIDALLAGLDATTSSAEVRPPPSEADVFELTDEMALPDAPQASFQKVEPDNDVEFTEAAPVSENRHAPAADWPSASDRAVSKGPVSSAPQEFLSHSTAAAVESAFNTLANTVLNNNARTLEDLVKEMMRPMLKSWLDDNLPSLVERIVKAEIERVSRGR